MEDKENNEFDSSDETKQVGMDDNKLDKDNVSFLQDVKHVLGIKNKEPSKEIQAMPSLEHERMHFSRSEIKKVFVFVFGAFVFVVGCILIPKLTEPKPPSPDVVASYNGKNITIEELKAFLIAEGSKEREHYICQKHGYDHSLCDASEECEKHPVDSLEGYKEVINLMASEQIILDWAEANGITQREEVQHEISDLFEHANVEEVVNQIYEQQLSLDSISKLDVQLYFDENREQYEGKNLSDVETEIRQILLSQKEEDYFPEYIDELKKTAGLEANYDLLKVTEPTNEEIKTYYEQNQMLYGTERLLNVSEIVIDATAGEEQAREAFRKIKVGENFDDVAAKYSKNQTVEKSEIIAGSDNSAREIEADTLNLNEISDVIKNEDGSYSIIRLDSIQESGVKKLKEVKDDIRKVLLLENQKKEYELRKDEVLFTVHGRRYTLGDFYREFLELPDDYQEALNEYEGKKRLVDQLIVKELLLEDYNDMAGSESESHDMEELKMEYLMQVMHEEEVEQKIADPTEEEIQKFYEDNMGSFVMPERIKLSVIWIAKTEDQKGNEKAKEALTAITEGAAFSEIAKQYSEDATAENGGIIDEWFYLEYMPEELVNGIKNLGVGEVSKIIESHGGLYIVQVDEKEEASQLTLEEARETIINHLKEEKHEELTHEMQKNMLEESNLVIYDRTIRKLLKEQQKEE